MPKSPTKNAPAAGSSSSASPYRFNFGMHRGKLLSEVPTSYLQWCVKAGVPDTRPDLKAALAERIRGGTHGEQRAVGLKERFPPWLWKACNDYLDRRLGQGFEGIYDMPISSGHDRREREELLRAALAPGRCRPSFVNRFPPRPSKLLPSSPSVDKLREVLSRAPRRSRSDFDPTDDGEVAGIGYHCDHASGDVWYTWAARFTQEVCDALVAVVEAHGDGAEGWETARWEVHDKYAECVDGISYCSDGGDKHWVDGASGWLDRKQGLNDEEEFEEPNALLAEQAF